MRPVFIIQIYGKGMGQGLLSFTGMEDDTEAGADPGWIHLQDLRCQGDGR